MWQVLQAFGALGSLHTALHAWRDHARWCTAIRSAALKLKRSCLHVLSVCIEKWWAVLEERKEAHVRGMVNNDDICTTELARAALERAAGDEDLAGREARALSLDVKIAAIAVRVRATTLGSTFALAASVGCP